MRIRRRDPTPAPRIDLPDSFDAYLAARSQNRRKQIRKYLRPLDRGEVTRAAAEQVRTTRASFDEVLGILPDAEAAPPELIEVIARREAARQARDFAEADRLRQRAVELGFSLEDVRGRGTRWRRL